MTTVGEGGASGRRRSRQWAGFGLLLGTLAVGVSCGSFPGPTPEAPLLPFGDGRRAQEGELTLRDGEEATIRYDKAFRAAPRLVIVEFRKSWSQDRPYSKSDFRFAKQDATGFRVVNEHFEPGRRTVATIKWRAEGVLAAEQPPAPTPAANTPGQIIEAVKGLGGTVTFDMVSPTRPILAIDLHHTRATDGHLEPFRALATLRSLNLSGTRVTDAGLKAVGGMTALQSLFLNQTAVSDAGLARLKGLTELRQLGLYHTQVTDDGLAHLGGLVNLRELTLSGPQITDRGLEQLKGLRSLRQLTLSQTGTTPAGIRELKKALPKLDVVQ
jgi:hypothetical protein